ncbi:MAG: heme biosynthesis HemY N-terminal domain-containing protein [Hyphomicrobiaceae bacterium]
MLRLIVFLLAVVAVATGLSWLADRPGLIVFNWEGYEGEISVFHAVVALTLLLGLAIFAWSLMRSVWMSPAAMGRYFNRRRQGRGLDALSSGMIAIGAGDKQTATRYAIQARKSLPNEPLTHLLRAQAAQLSGDKATARRIFEAMLASPDTEQLGLRGLFLEAEREGEREAALQFAERALKLNPKLGWSADALFDLQCKSADWEGALATVAMSRKHGHLDKPTAERRRAVLLAAQAQRAEDSDPERALSLALESHNLAPGLVPAAAIAGRILASRGNTPKATKVLQRTWVKSPHPDLATAYAYARLGDSPRDRLERVKQLARLTSNSIESPIAVARAAIESRDFDAARAALEPLLEGRMTQRVATLMARIEGEQHGDKGRVRDWLARAVNAPRDPAWTADGIVSDTWAPVSPVTGQLDAFQWRVPVESMDSPQAELLAQKLEELVALGAPVDTIEARAVAPVTDAAPGAGRGAAAASTDSANDLPADHHVTAEASQPVSRAAAAAAGAVSAATASGVAKSAAAAPIAASAERPTEPEASSATARATAPAPTAPVSAHVAAGGGEPSRQQRAAADSGAKSEATAAKTSPVIVTAADPVAQSATGNSSSPAAAGTSVVPAKSSLAGAEPSAGEAPVMIADRERTQEHPSQPGRRGAAAKPAATKRPAQQEPNIFVSPRAPDDPGTEVEADNEPTEPLELPRRSFANR